VSFSPVPDQQKHALSSPTDRLLPPLIADQTPHTAMHRVASIRVAEAGYLLIAVTKEGFILVQSSERTRLWPSSTLKGSYSCVSASTCLRDWYGSGDYRYAVSNSFAAWGHNVALVFGVA
jgi:hypothetical protein